MFSMHFFTPSLVKGQGSSIWQRLCTTHIVYSYISLPCYNMLYITAEKYRILATTEKKKHMLIHMNHRFCSLYSFIYFIYFSRYFLTNIFYRIRLSTYVHAIWSAVIIV